MRINKPYGTDYLKDSDYIQAIQNGQQVNPKNMVLLEQFIQKRKIKMKNILSAIFITIVGTLQVVAQDCIDTVRVKGYYIVERFKNEIAPPKIIQKDSATKVLTNRIDVRYNTAFITLDSINKLNNLGDRLNHLLDDTMKIKLSCICATHPS